MPTPIADQMITLALRMEHGDVFPQDARRELRDLAGQARALEDELRDLGVEAVQLRNQLSDAVRRETEWRELYERLEAREEARRSSIAASGPLADSAYSRAPHVAGPVAEVFGEDLDD